MAVAGAGARLADQPAHRHLRTGAGASAPPFFCAGINGGSIDDDTYVIYGGGSGKIIYLRNLSQAECTSTTLGLLVAYLGAGITAANLACNVGVASP